MIDIVKLVHLKFSLLDWSQIDLVSVFFFPFFYLSNSSEFTQFEARLGVIIQKLNSITDKGAVLEEMDKVSKV